MATFVASIESQPASERAEFACAQPDLRFAVLLVSGFTLFALAVHGYHPYAEDGGLYVAGVKRLLNPALYLQQPSFVLEPTRYSLFASLLAAMVRLSHLGLPVVLLGLHLASIWITLFATWMLAARCWPTREARAGAVVLLACWLTLPVAGTALSLMDPYLTARSFSTPCTLLALVGALVMTERISPQAQRRGFALCIGVLTLAAAMHPLMAAYAVGATLMLVCARSSKSSARLWETAALCASAIFFAACLQAVASPESAEYIRVALTRTYWFPAEWRWYELTGLLAPLAILAAQGWAARTRARVPEARRALAQMAVAAGATAYAIAELFARAGAATHLVARLQPLRAFQIVYLIMVLVLGAKLGEFALQRSLWRWIAAITLLGGTMFVVAQTAFPNSNHLELPGIAARNPWVQAFLWIRNNTPNDALFALDPDYINAAGEDAQCFRAIAERSALPDYSKDGGEASIAPELTGAWQRGQAAQQSLHSAAGANPNQADSARIAALGLLGVSWIVLDAGATTNLDCPYVNRAVRVCRLR